MLSFIVRKGHRWICLQRVRTPRGHNFLFMTTSPFSTGYGWIQHEIQYRLLLRWYPTSDRVQWLMKVVLETATMILFVHN